MQPHSMCNLALLCHMWSTKKDPAKTKLITSASCRVEFTDVEGKSKSIVYRLRVDYHNDDMTKLKINVIRDGGGLSCTLESERHSKSDGFKVVVTHGTIHTSSLREEYELNSYKVRGQHYNSEKYKDFNGEFDRDFENLLLSSNRIGKGKQYTFSPYKLKLENVSYKKA